MPSPNRIDSFTPKKNGETTESPAANQPPAKPAEAGGIKAWLPLIIALTAMPLLAYATTQFVLLPRLASATTAAGGEGRHGGQPAAEQMSPRTESKTKVTASLNKILVNIAGSVGTRYLLTSLTLVSNVAEFKQLVESNRDQLLDVASGCLSNKTIPDLEKPGARNLIRNELILLFNNVLGGSAVKELYITEFAIQ